ncbi:hypothetical protein EB796_000125 [Bugula neritina]|uniref:Uncharacterized protein n=1 Tax=Bugula neritina TaxID=10212 RepID=A0A7J7KU03_BUGNE|nr:hypothetical protein EB796_000125 [Bugula neritina]
MTTLCKNGAFSVTNFTPIKIVSATGNKSESRPSLVSPQVTQSGSGRLYAVPVYPAGVSNGNSKAAPVLVVPTSSIAPTSTTTNYTTVQTAAVEVPPADKANT